MNSDFIELYESLSVLNEDTKSDAGKRFWAAVKNKQIDEASFHTAYDEELTDLGLMDLFNTEGALANRGTYGKIKAAKEANPNSWAVKALVKLWALRYVDNVLFSSELAAKELQDKKAAERQAELEKRNQEYCEKVLNEYREVLPEALAAIKPELVKQYLEAYNIKESDINFEIVKSSMGENRIAVLPTKLYIYTLKNDDVNLRSRLISMLTTEFNRGIQEAERAEARKKAQSNDAIDVIKANSHNRDTICNAILMGESGTLYYLYINGGRLISQLSKDLGKEVTQVGYLSDITEEYKVIYTSVSYSPTNYSTYRDTESNTYYSWASSEEALLKPILPELGKGEGSWSYWEVVSIKKGNGKYYSLMDNIDTWARKDHTSIATD